MQIQVNTDNTIDGNQALKVRVLEVVEHVLRRFGERITRLEIHLQDVNAHKGGRDIKCTMEARMAGVQPVTVDALGEEPLPTVRAAVKKLERALETREAKRTRVR